MTKEETIQELQQVIDENQRPLLVKVHIGLLIHALKYLKEQDAIKQKMWNALYAEEDKLEKYYTGTDKHYWFSVYRPWLQRGFEIAIEVIAKQEKKGEIEMEERRYCGKNHYEMMEVLDKMCELEDRIDLDDEEQDAFDIAIQCITTIMNRMKSDEPIIWG